MLRPITLVTLAALAGCATQTPAARNTLQVAVQPPAPMPEMVIRKPAGPDMVAANSRGAAAKPEPLPLCPGWEKLTGDKLSPWPPSDAAATASVPPFDAAH